MNTLPADASAAYLNFLSSASGERLARVTARKAFVEMKLSFMRAAERVHGSNAPSLQRQVRLSREMTELWRLRGPLFDGLPTHDPQLLACRDEVQYHLDSAFPDGSGSMPLS